MTECDVCLREMHRDDVDLVWFCGFETWVCADCRECPPEVDREIDRIRGK